ncbi:SBBP repeat-containing protein [Dyadobacter sp. 676]|uniref:SBBP repeat-containing protein n=1 Tax=Dyadobacter sp. 676 TaxID=3088362 RepID=A0AAU8FGG3_9BACT
MQKRFLLFLALWGWTTYAATAQAPAVPPPPQRPAEQVSKDKMSQWLKDAAGAGFTENRGQLVNQAGKPNKAVKYLLSMPGLKVQLRQTGFSYDTYTTKNKFHRVDIELLGANPAAAMTTGPAVSEPVNVVNGNGEFYGIHKFQTVTYRDVYPGIDLEFVARKGTDKPVEYNFIVRPGADASQIRLKYKGANQTVLKNGRVVMALNHGALNEHIPASWIDQTGQKVSVRYKATGADVYAFHVPSYDRTKTLVIDPTPQLEWATYYGGTAVDQIAAVATDASGNIYVTGNTASSFGIATAGAYDGSYGGGVTGTTPNEDAFLAKFNSAGQRIWATYYGGAGRDLASALAVHGNVLYIGGTTTSTGMATAGAHQTAQTAANQNTGFLARFDATTGQRTWGSYFGGSMPFFPSRIVVDNQNNFYAYGSIITGTQTPTGVDIATPGTFRPNLPATIVINQIQSALVKFNDAGVRQWGTYVDFSQVFAGPPLTSTISYLGAMDLDADGQVYVSGATTNTDLAANAPPRTNQVRIHGCFSSENR